MSNIILLHDTTSIAQYVEDAINSVVEGEVDPVIAISNLAKLKKAIDTIENDSRFRDAVMAEVDKYSEKIIEMGDTKIEKAEVGVKYDYSCCNDSKYEGLKLMAQYANNDVKERENYLKNLPKDGITELDELTGEVRQIMPPVKKSKSWIKITINKR